MPTIMRTQPVVAQFAPRIIRPLVAGGSAFLTKLNLSTDGPAFTADSIVNSAGFVPGVPAGGLGTIFRRGLTNLKGSFGSDGFPLPRELGGITVRLDGEPVPQPD